jgi:23S rRNA (uracil1939-C5)-methyltransferase
LAELFDRLAGVDVGGIVTLRAGVRTGERAMIVDETAVDLLRDRGVPATTESQTVVHELVGRHSFRISGRSFFQVNTEGAEQLVELAGEAAGDLSGRHLLDGYAGGGLFAACLGQGAHRVTAIESDPVAGDDLAHNMPGAELIRQTVESGLDLMEDRPDVMIADPPRAGMGAVVIESIARLRPPVVVVVACDPAGFARDARLLVDRGYRLEWVAPVDMFPQTPHIETVARFVLR